MSSLALSRDIAIAYKSDLREIGGSVLLCFFAAIDSSGGGLAKSGLKIFVTQKLTAWQLFLIYVFFGVDKSEKDLLYCLQYVAVWAPQPNSFQIRPVEC